MVYVFLANGFEEMEALTPVDLLRRAGLEVITVGVTGKTVVGAHNIPVVADIEVNEIKLSNDIQMIVLPGGMPGTSNLENSGEVLAAVDYCSENNRFIAAICAAPSILGHKGLLSGLRCTCFPGYEKELIGSIFTGKAVVTDRNIITAKGAGASLKFAIKLVEMLKGKPKALSLETVMQCRD